MTGRTALASGLCILLTGCGDPAPGEGMEHPTALGPTPSVLGSAEALQTPEIPRIDPGTMVEAEFEKVIPEGPRCTFAYTEASPPILAAAINPETGTALGVTKIHGRLVSVEAQGVSSFESLSAGGTFDSERIRLKVMPTPEKEGQVVGSGNRWPADLTFEVKSELHVGYRGWYTCDLLSP